MGNKPVTPFEEGFEPLSFLLDFHKKSSSLAPRTWRSSKSWLSVNKDKTRMNCQNLGKSRMTYTIQSLVANIFLYNHKKKCQIYIGVLEILNQSSFTDINFNS